MGIGLYSSSFSEIRRETRFILVLLFEADGWHSSHTPVIDVRHNAYDMNPVQSLGPTNVRNKGMMAGQYRIMAHMMNDQFLLQNGSNSAPHTQYSDITVQAQPQLYST